MHPPLLNHSPRVLTHRLGFQSLGIRLGFHASSAPLEGILLSTFRVLNFRDWFGAQIIECTFKHMPRSRFRVLKFRDWFRQTKEYYIPGQTKEPGRKGRLLQMVFQGGSCESLVQLLGHGHSPQC